MENNSFEKRTSRSKSYLSIFLISVLLAAGVSTVISRSTCSKNWIGSLFGLPKECSSTQTNGVVYDGANKLSYTDSSGVKKEVDLSSLAKLNTKTGSTTNYKLDSTNLIATSTDKSTGEATTTTVDLAPLLEGLRNQETSTNITNNSTTVVGKDQQTLQLIGNILTIAGGNSINLAAVGTPINSNTLAFDGSTNTLTSTVNGISTNTTIGITKDWSLAGNSGTDPSTNFLGTTDAKGLVFKTNNTEAARIDQNGNLGVGVSSPAYKLDVNGMLNQTTTLPDGRTTSIHSGDNVIGAGIKGVGFTSKSTTGPLSYLFAGDSTATGGPTNQAGVGLTDFANNNAQLLVSDQGGSYSIGLQTNGSPGNTGLSLNNATIQLSTNNNSNSSNLDFTPDSLTLSRGDLILNSYPNNRDDLASNPTQNFLYTDSSGKVLSAPINSLSQNAWSLVGNSGTNPGTNFIGTTDAQDLVIKTNNLEVARVAANGNVGIGTTTAPLAKLQINAAGGQGQIISEDGATFGADGLVGGYPSLATVVAKDQAYYYQFAYASGNSGKIANFQAQGTNTLEYDHYNTSEAFQGSNYFLSFGGYAGGGINTNQIAGVYKYNQDVLAFGSVTDTGVATNNTPSLAADLLTRNIGVGTTTPKSALEVQGNYGQTITKLPVGGASSYTATGKDGVLYVTASAATLSIKLPDPTTVPGMQIPVVKGTGSTGLIDITTPAGQIEDSTGAMASSTSIPSNGGTQGFLNSRIVFMSDGTNWLRIQ